MNISVISFFKIYDTSYGVAAAQTFLLFLLLLGISQRLSYAGRKDGGSERKKAATNTS